MRLGSILLIVWLVIGTIAAVQRDYFDGGDANCAQAGTIALTILAGPLNYVGLDPEVDDCDLPEPSEG